MNLLVFENISIRGRVAFAICCLRYAITKQADVDEFQSIFKRMQSFLISEDLEEWYSTIAEIIPDTIMDYDEYLESDFEKINRIEFTNFKNMYLKLDREILKIIDLIFFVGTAELYGRVIKNGKSLSYLGEIIELMKRKDFQIPDSSKFLKFDFNTGLGWGGIISNEEIDCTS